MQQVTIGANQAGQRLDKFLHKYLPQAGTGFLYKMLRKKNITLNGKKAEGKEQLTEGDVVCFFFSDETFEKFSDGGAQAEGTVTGKLTAYREAYRILSGIAVLYEDEQIAVLNKPVGILTQKAAEGDLSLNEWLVGYLLDSGAVSEEELRSFRPSVANRLDRNTSGIVLCGKSLKGLQRLSEGIRDRSISKFYRTICVGELREDRELHGYLVKDEKTNRVQVFGIEEEGRGSREGKRAVRKVPDMDERGSGEDVAVAEKVPDADEIRTAYHPIAAVNGYTLLEVELFTGKTHQIRAHLAGIGHPIIGDYKYGDRKLNDRLKERFGLEYQLLHAYRMVLPEGMSGGMADDTADVMADNAADAMANDAADVMAGGREIIAPYPAYFEKIAEELGLL